MPEVGIGFFPDVGAAWFLPRLKHRVGVYFALTGLRADAGDALALGLAQTFVPSAAFPALAQALESDEPVKATLARFATPPPPLSADRRGRRHRGLFLRPDREAILDGLAQAETQGRAFAAPARAAMLEKSPTSQAIALKQMALGATIDFDEALRMDYRIVSRICRGHDFYEGVRAVIVDKDNRPHWSPPPSRAEVDAYFAPLGDERAHISGAGRMKYIMRQSRDGAVELIDRSPAAPKDGDLLSAISRSGLGDGAHLVHAHARLGLGRQRPVRLGDHSRRVSEPRPVHDYGAASAGDDCRFRLLSIFWRRSGYGWLRPGAGRSGSCARWSRPPLPILSPRAAAIGLAARCSMSRWSPAISC